MRASDASHQMPNSEKPKPTENTIGTTATSGAPSANVNAATGHASVSISPVNIGRRGRQRIPTSAPTTAPPPATLSSTPNTPAPP